MFPWLCNMCSLCNMFESIQCVKSRGFPAYLMYLLPHNIKMKINVPKLPDRIGTEVFLVLVVI